MSVTLLGRFVVGLVLVGCALSNPPVASGAGGDPVPKPADPPKPGGEAELNAKRARIAELEKAAAAKEKELVSLRAEISKLQHEIDYPKLSPAEVAAELKAFAALKEKGIFVINEDWVPGTWSHVQYRLKDPPGAVFYQHLAAIKILKSLEFYECPVTDDEFERIGRLKTLTCLDVSQSKITGAGVKHLVGLKELGQVYFCDSPVKDVVFDGLAKLPNLTTINLAGTRVTGAGIRQLADHKKLWFVSLRRTSATDAGIKEIGAVTSLTDIDLSGTAITDASVPVLSRLTKLEQLDVSQTGLTPEGLRQLRKALPKCAVTSGPGKRQP